MRPLRSLGRIPATFLALLHQPWLFGPVLAHGLIQSGRRRRSFLLRSLYGLLLLFLAYGTTYFATRGEFVINERRALAHAADNFFSFVVITQFVLVLFLIPASTGSALAREKDGQSLELLLATDLS
jgi:hypothetical protein